MRARCFAALPHAKSKIIRWRLMVHPDGRKTEEYAGTNPLAKSITSSARKHGPTTGRLLTCLKEIHYEFGEHQFFLIPIMVFQVWLGISTWTESWWHVARA